MTWKCKSIAGKIQNKNIDAGVKFDAHWDDKVFFKVPKFPTEIEISQ